MKALFASAALMLGLMTTGVYAADVATPATAPTGSTGLCNDGSYYNGAAKKGACRGHKGVKDWYGTGTAAAAVTTTAAPVALPKKTTVTTTTSVAATGPAPAGATGLCNDGTYYTGANKKGACRGHKGVKDWYATAGATTAATTTAAAPAPEKKGFSLFGKKPAEPAAAPASAATPAPANVAAKAAPAAAVTAGAVAAGGGAGQVWVNTDSNVYHCQGSHWYGKTKQGQYMTEAAAKAAGARPDHNKACS
ncbi:DUF3761 domain-containing protein [Aquirhabdus sp.]|uniref:DUF3761 domain-containing protein n=1 Tax=Aquirhabdus sp. TaxID=2824160 RepID=UPI00396CC94F